MNEPQLPEILIVSSYPPRECGIATYSQDLVRSLNNKFNNSFKINVCALESESEKYTYPEEPEYILDTSHSQAYDTLARSINGNKLSKLLLIQHEFGFFRTNESHLLHLISSVSIPVMITFHTVLPNPDTQLKQHVHELAAASATVTVMTESAAQILQTDYEVPPGKIAVIEHGTHLVQHLDKASLKHKYGFSGKTILSTFGLISSGKNIETTLEALPGIVRTNPDTLFLVIGKTHPTVLKHEGETYRLMLEAKVAALKLEQHVKFINYYLPLTDLLEYLQLTDVYLFTSKDPHQAVSGTFSYAISCGCPIISTPIPHAREVLSNGAGILIDFENADQLGKAVIRLLADEELKKNISLNGLHRIISTAWENVAIAHAQLFDKLSDEKINLRYSLPAVNLDHIHNLTTDFGMFQFSKINHPDPDSGYTLDDNARAMVALCLHYEITGHPGDPAYIATYLHFITHCMQANGRFLNYVDCDKNFTLQNDETNLDDANGRAVWALGYLISQKNTLPEVLVSHARQIIDKALAYMSNVHSTRALAFALKGLFYYNKAFPGQEKILMAEKMANRLERMYEHECDADWTWFESYLTYGNSILPEGMLCAHLITGNPVYKSIAKSSFDFLLSNTFTPARIKPISNRSWLQKGKIAADFGEQPIDVAYTILALHKFHEVFKNDDFLEKMQIAFNWFLGNNHLSQIIYNPCTGGCYDGLEEKHINLNQGAESTVSYLMARLTMEKIKNGACSLHSELLHQQAEQ